VLAGLLAPLLSRPGVSVRALVFNTVNHKWGCEVQKYRGSIYYSMWGIGVGTFFRWLLCSHRFPLGLNHLYLRQCIGVSHVWLVNMQIYQWVRVSVGWSGYCRVDWFIFCVEVVRWSVGVHPVVRGWGDEFYGWWLFRRVSKIALENMVWLSFKWLLAVNSAWMWNISMCLGGLLTCGNVAPAWCCLWGRGSVLSRWGAWQN
jgi:hypothetical protein